ncbi:MAG: diacylglycerol kinase family protein [Maribacter sp.]|nr:diacylglycerol kinase family protein [Maribacter sp.]
MPQNKRTSVQTFLKGFQYAFQGMRLLVRERNMKFHMFAALLVIIAAWYFHLTVVEWTVILLCIGLVVSIEALNTAVEYLCDYIQPEHDAKIGSVKDIAAAAVFIAAVISAIVGLIIFLPKII